MPPLADMSSHGPMPVKALSVTAELVTGVEPFAEHGLLAFAMFPPVEGAVLSPFTNNGLPRQLTLAPRR